MTDHINMPELAELFRLAVRVWWLNMRAERHFRRGEKLERRAQQHFGKVAAMRPEVLQIRRKLGVIR